MADLTSRLAILFGLVWLFYGVWLYKTDPARPASQAVSANSEQRVRPVRVRCPIGGYAPCVDDMCHGGGGSTTMCGLEEGEDFCWHGFYPETCDDPQCNGGDWAYE